MKKYAIVSLIVLTGFVTYTYAFTPSQYEKAKSVAQEYINGSLTDESWKSSHPQFPEREKMFIPMQTPHHI